MLYVSIALTLAAVYWCTRSGSRAALIYLAAGIVVFTYQLFWALGYVPGAEISDSYWALRLDPESLVQGYAALLACVSISALLSSLMARKFPIHSTKLRPVDDLAVTAEILSWLGLSGLGYLRFMGADSLLDDWGRNWNVVPFAGLASYIANLLCTSSVYWVLYIRRGAVAPRFLAPVVIGCLLQSTSGTAGYAVVQALTVGLAYLLREQQPNRIFLRRAALIGACCVGMIAGYRYMRSIGAIRAGVSTDFTTLKLANSFGEIVPFSAIYKEAQNGGAEFKNGRTYLCIVAGLMPSFIGGQWKQDMLITNRSEVVIGREYVGIDVLIPATVYGEGIINFGLVGLLIPILMQGVILWCCERQLGYGVWSRIVMIFFISCALTGLRDTYFSILSSMIAYAVIMGVAYQLTIFARGASRILYPFIAIAILALVFVAAWFYLRRI
jgi:hypothetical protein